MQNLFHDARYRDAASVYDEAVIRGETSPNDAILLRARLFLKTDSKQVIPFLLKEELDKPTKAQVARREMYLGTGYSRLGDFTAADEHFSSSKAMIQDGPASAELAAHITRRYLEQRDLESAELWQKKSLVDRTLTGKIRSEHLASYIFARREHYRDQALSVIRVLDLIGPKRQDHPEDWYVAVHTLSVLARELPMEDAAARAKAEVDADFEWSPDFAVNHFQALKGVAWCQALKGDELSCFRYLRLAQEVSVGKVWRAILHLDRAFFAAIVGEQQWSANEFASAEDLAQGISWEETSGEERVALLLLAELATLHAPKRALFYIARFNHLGKLRTNIQHFAFDDRLQGIAGYSTGIVKLSSGDRAAAEEHLRSAWSTFDRIGYDVRAALAAMALYRATNKPRWLHLAEDKIEAYPGSWLARKLRQTSMAQEASESQALSKMQTTVTRMVCEGLSTDEIADRLGLSPNTILNHLKVIYKKLGVKSRPALVVKAMHQKVSQ